VLWKQTIGDYPELKAKGIHAGSENFGAPVVTKGGLVFIAATRDEKIRAFNKETGELHWEADLPAAGVAPPAVYEVNGKEFIVIALRRRRKTADKIGRSVRRLRAPGRRGRRKRKSLVEGGTIREP
jgi:quinoprotein glucose dehydrogenase